jgi:hypothetical protein
MVILSAISFKVLMGLDLNDREVHENVASERMDAKAGLSFAIGAKNSGPSTRPAP